MTWTPDPFKHVAQVSVTASLPSDVDVEITIDDVPVDDATEAAAYVAGQVAELIARLKPKRRPHKRKSQPDPKTPADPQQASR